MARPKQISAQNEPALLRAPRTRAREQLISRTELGKSLLKRQISSSQELKEARNEYYKWSDYNDELLARLFTNRKYAIEYSSYIGGIFLSGTPISREIQDHFDDISTKIRRLESITERLDLIDEVPGTQSTTDRPRLERPSPSSSDKVFVVHGRDEEMKATVARFLSKLGLNPIILAEQVNGGRTVIEKFEQEADVPFAVVLLSPDDVGGLKGTKTTQDRARQNVILELGYFIGRLGRSNVCALKKGDIELPSDFVGVVYTPFTGEDGWKLKLAQEMRAAGMRVDLNLI